MVSFPPSVDALAAAIDDGSLPRPVLIEIARRTVAAWRDDPVGDPTERARHEVGLITRRRGRVINATGVLLHTNLGRAPLHPDAIAAAAAAAGDYSPLEMDLATGQRGGRGAYLHTLVAAATGAEAALVVNNNAGALMLAIAALAGGREVVVSRGELIEIGGSFRLPEIVAAAGARSVEVGTTNRTRLADYRKAVSAATGALLKVHPSNYRVEGFTAEVTYRELAEFADVSGVPLVADVGSGLLDERVPWISGPPPPWLAGEPGMRQVLEAGAGLALCSGDKLLGGPQAGIVAGRAELVARLGAHPMARSVRAGGMQLAALAATLELYTSGRGGEIPFWRMAALTAAELETRSGELIAAAGVGAVVTDRSLPGAGSAPGHGIPGPVIALPGGDAARLRLLAADPPVVARLDRDRLLVDLRAVPPADDPALARALAAACR
jgi:L-seryl-tRNA(Ser) seleniumtransferase